MATVAPDAGGYARDTAQLLWLGASLVALRQRHDRLTALFLSAHGNVNAVADVGQIVSRLERTDQLLGRVERRMVIIATAIAALAEKCGDGS